MKKVIFSAVFALMTTVGFAQELTGKWLTEDKDAVIEFFRSGDKMNGRIVSLVDGKDSNGKAVKDVLNPDKSKRNEPLVGLLMLRDLKQKGDKWEDGNIYDPSEGKSYKCSIWLENGKLKVRGYSGMFYQTQTWTRNK